MCAKGNTSCSCPDNLPSCVGKTDGDHAFPTRMWKPDYVKCYKNRTILPTKRCTKGYFHPVQNKCMEDVPKRMLFYIVHIFHDKTLNRNYIKSNIFEKI